MNARLVVVSTGVVCLGACAPPDRVVLGFTMRQLKGSHSGVRANTFLPLTEAELTREVSPRVDWRVNFQFLGLTEDWNEWLIPHTEVNGCFLGFGGGWRFFPFPTRALGFDLGVESFVAEYHARWRLGPLRFQLRDHFWGGGGTLGLAGEWPISGSGSRHLAWGVGYYFGAASTSRPSTEVELSGWYGKLGLAIPLTSR